MSRLASELERLAQAVQALEAALEQQEERHARDLEAARGRTEEVAGHVDSAIQRIEAVLGE
jgi:hypothetical protein